MSFLSLKLRLFCSFSFGDKTAILNGRNNVAFSWADLREVLCESLLLVKFRPTCSFSPVHLSHRQVPTELLARAWRGVLQLQSHSDILGATD